MVKYICRLCKKTFKYESTYMKHKNRKTLCVNGKKLKKLEENVAYILLSLNKKRTLKIVFRKNFIIS